MTSHPVAPIAVVGPTASGKSAVADTLAVRLGGEIVSADSMQVYRGMDVGTAKTPPGDRGVPYHCIDLVEPGEPYSAALYQRDARAAIEPLLAAGRTPVLVGGTGLYLRAALDEFEFPSGQLRDDVRCALERRAETEGAATLHEELATLDPEGAALIHPHNVRRTVRALEMLASGRRYSDQAAGFGERRTHYPGTVFIGLTMDREALYTRIDTRVDAMVQAGLVDEVRKLLSEGYRDALTAAQAIGYKEFVPVVEGTARLEDAAEDVKRSTRRYAKRQLTWFRGDPRVRWIDVTELSPAEAVERAFDLLESSAHHA